MNHGIKIRGILNLHTYPFVSEPDYADKAKGTGLTPQSLSVY